MKGHAEREDLVDDHGDGGRGAFCGRGFGLGDCGTDGGEDKGGDSYRCCEDAVARCLDDDRLAVEAEATVRVDFRERCGYGERGSGR